jgi:hypothetical protein
MVGYLSIPSPEMILYGIASSEHFSSISQPTNERKKIESRKEKIQVYLPVSGVEGRTIRCGPGGSCLADLIV